MNIDNKLEVLKKIRPVDAPPFLFIRIKSQIQNLENLPAPVQWAWGFVTAAIVIISLNIAVFSNNIRESQGGSIRTVAQTLQLSNTNTLYR